jgi:hypothetical protein
VAQRKKRNSDHSLLIALACGATVEAAARQLGISERAAYRRMEKPDFKRELNQLRSEMVQRAAAMLTAASMESVKTLLELQKSPNLGPTRLGAARSILEIGIKLRAMAELEVRVAELEVIITGKDPDD